MLPKSACGIVETLHIVRWMANESARQCGPCAFGLPALTEDLTLIAHQSRDPAGALTRLRERCGVIEGRGACRHPDGVIRLVRSALTIFADDVANHVKGDVCKGSRSQKLYTSVPTLEREEELVWE